MLTTVNIARATGVPLFLSSLLLQALLRSIVKFIAAIVAQPNCSCPWLHLLFVHCLSLLALLMVARIILSASCHRGRTAMAAASTTPRPAHSRAALAPTLVVFDSLAYCEAHRLLLFIATMQDTSERDLVA